MNFLINYTNEIKELNQNIRRNIKENANFEHNATHNILLLAKSESIYSEYQTLLHTLCVCVYAAYRESI